ncbi:hypothetical protein SDC9_183303 [bioreactor metagenome]|uniref:Uncharacterized protein n=1 Tax=bioreactor metagenome TaxID=1076179 RepID=A0A645H9V4_9ZZZZ
MADIAEHGLGPLAGLVDGNGIGKQRAAEDADDAENKVIRDGKKVVEIEVIKQGEGRAQGHRAQGQAKGDHGNEQLAHIGGVAHRVLHTENGGGAVVKLFFACAQQLAQQHGHTHGGHGEGARAYRRSAGNIPHLIFSKHGKGVGEQGRFLF